MIQEITLKIVSTFIEMAPYLMLGLFFAGLLHIFFSKDLISKHLSGNPLTSSIKASVLGVPLPLCSCGVVPTALSLRKSSASNSATVSFLISTPQTGIDSIIATYGMMGPVFAVFRPVAALFMGIFGGIITGLFSPSEGEKGREKEKQEKSGNEECRVCGEYGEHSHSLMEKIVSIFRYAFGEFLDDIAIQLVIGIAISGLIAYFVPDSFFSEYIGSGILGMLLMILAGIPLYICATASIPIAVTMMLKGLSPGAAFVFLAVGPATNAATVTLLVNALGKKIAAVYLGVISAGAVVSGLILNSVYSLFDFRLAEQMGHIHGESQPVFAVGLSVIFAGILAFSIARRYLPFAKSDASSCSSCDNTTCAINPDNDDYDIIGVDGMTCSKCAQHVEESLYSVPGIRDVSVDLKGKKALVKGDYSRKAAFNAVREAGYTPS